MERIRSLSLEPHQEKTFFRDQVIYHEIGWKVLTCKNCGQRCSAFLEFLRTINLAEALTMENEGAPWWWGHCSHPLRLVSDPEELQRSVETAAAPPYLAAARRAAKQQ